LQLVVPCYNEAARLDAGEFARFVATRTDVHLLFVDDGSTDNTSQVLNDLAARSTGRISTVVLPANVGKAAAVQHGIALAFDRQPELVGYWDADLATPLVAIDDFLAVLDTNRDIDIVMGARVKLLGRRVERHALRHYFGRIYATAASMALGIEVYDTQCGAKIFRANAPIRQVFGKPFRSRWVFDIELLARYATLNRADGAGAGIYELPLKTWTDVAGSKVRLWHSARALWDIARIWHERLSPSS
jgi:glycosyltransferase involved in cell wall biosynthesis